MRTQVVNILADEIVDWDSFHDVFDEALGFPNNYGRNMDAWIDCLTDVDTENGTIAKPVATGDILALSINDAANFRRRCPERFDALIECTAFVNFRRREVGESPILALLIDGNFA